jgi:hypothetical protein
MEFKNICPFLQGFLFYLKHVTICELILIRGGLTQKFDCNSKFECIENKDNNSFSLRLHNIYTCTKEKKNLHLFYNNTSPSPFHIEFPWMNSYHFKDQHILLFIYCLKQILGGDINKQGNIHYKSLYHVIIIPTRDTRSF